MVGMALTAWYGAKTVDRVTVVRTLARALVDLFFKEHVALNADLVPPGPTVLVIAPHSNQFIDPSVAAYALPRPVRFLTAAKSLRRNDVGPVIRATNPIPVERPQDLKTRGQGLVRLDGRRVVGLGTRFLGQGIPAGPAAKGWTLLLEKLSPGEPKPKPLQLAAVASDAEAELAADPPPHLLAGDQAGRKYVFMPHINHRDMFSEVYRSLDNGEIVGIFPEGGSHDRPHLLPLKAGCAIMALGAMANNPRTAVQILPCGLTYFNRDKPNSRVVCRYGAPIDIPRQLVEAYEQGGGPKRVAVSSLLEEVDAALKRVAASAESWAELQTFWAIRDLYVPTSRLVTMTAAEMTTLAQALIDDYPRVKADPRVRPLMQRVLEYHNRLKSYGLTDRLSVQNRHIIGTRKTVGSLCIFWSQFVALSCIAVLWLPVDLSILPHFLIMGWFSKRKAKEALAASTVKIRATDVVATFKIIIGVPLYVGLHLVYSGLAWAWLGDGGAVVFFFFAPLLQYIAFKATGADAEAVKNLYSLGYSLLFPQHRDALAQERVRLKQDVRAVVDALGWGKESDLDDMSFDRGLTKNYSLFDRELTKKFTIVDRHTARLGELREWSEDEGSGEMEDDFFEQLGAGIAEVFESMGPAESSDSLTDDETFRSAFPPPAATGT